MNNMVNYETAVYSEQHSDTYQKLLNRREDINTRIKDATEKMTDIMDEIDRKSQYAGFVIAGKYQIERFKVVDYFNYQKFKEENPALYNQYYQESGNRYLRVTNLLNLYY